MINRRTFMNTTATGIGGICLLPFTKAFAGGYNGKGEVSVKIDSRYLNFPVRTGAKSQHLKLLVDGEIAREFDIELVESDPEWWPFMDVDQFQGKLVTLQIDNLSEGFKGLSSIMQADEIIGTENLYNEKRRPQFHFSTRRGWINDPNGLVYYEGEYHLFYQLNPYGWGAAQKHWGHAVSKDLVHWKELPVALHTDKQGEIYSGSAVIDWNNTAGFEEGNEKTMVAMYTAAGKPFTQGLAYSNDRGRSWNKYENNPVLPNITKQNRDPKVIWYAPENKWIMVLYHDNVGWPPPTDLTPEALSDLYKTNGYGFFSSPDLKQWERMSELKLPGDGECAEFFEIAVDGNPKNTRWIFYGAKGLYFIGSFDGTTFTPEPGLHQMQYGNCFYASQTFNDIPNSDGRRILIPWGVSWAGVLGNDGEPVYKDMPFNQMLGLPVELTLRTTEEGLSLYSEPVEELTSLRGKAHAIEPKVIQVGDNPLAEISGELLDIEAEISPGSATVVQFNLRGVSITYDTQKQEISCAEKTALLKMEDGKIRLRFLVDRTSIDIFGNDGRLYMPMGMAVPENNHTLEMTVVGGEAQIHSMNIFELKSAWT